jgi:predicted glycoside hydrolase/deacetylase ChbG (UPF0249 family)
MKNINRLLLVVACISIGKVFSQETTYAEKLGFPKGKKVLILHVDDVGMSWDSNQGVIQAMEKGVSNSCSVMMPCPWVPNFVHYLKEHPDVDAGLHLTLTSEWKEYRWPPLSGQSSVPGLVDKEGAMHSSVDAVVKSASAAEVEKEIRAQLQRAKAMGFNPTHLDSHMGTLFASPDFLQRYIKVGIENQIPVMFPGGHATMIGASVTPEVVKQMQTLAKTIWDNGLPVLDDLHNVSYGFNYTDALKTDKAIQDFATDQYIKTIKELKPGLTMVIMHCTAPSEIFQYISGSGTTRKGDLLAMTDPKFKKYLDDEGIILTTWREVKGKRDNIK